MKQGLPRIGMHIPRRGALVTGPGVAAIARLSEELGFDSLWAGDHIAFPWEDKGGYPYTESGKMFWSADTPWADPLVSLTWAGAATTRIKLGTSIYILALRSPIAVAKTLSTIDVFTNGRMILGVGAGWLEGEFDIVGQSFKDRGSRTTEGIRAMKACWRDDRIELTGKHFNFPAFAMEPKPVQGDKLPVFCGGFSDPAMRRAAEVGDGWMPSHLKPDQYAAKLPKLREYVERAGRSMSDLTLVVTGLGQPLTYDLAMRYADVGVSLILADADYNGSLDNAVASVKAVAKSVRLAG